MANVLAYGFEKASHLLGKRLSAVNQQELFKAIQESNAEYNRIRNELLSELVERTILNKERFHLPGSGTMQPLDSGGNPIPRRETASYDVAYPLQGAGDAYGADRVVRALMTTDELNRNLVEAFRKDTDWLRRHMFGALAFSSTWTFTDDLVGSLTIQPLANGDTVTYPLVGGSNATDNHYLAQAAAIGDSNNPFDDIHTELMGHPSNLGGKVVVYIPTNLVAATEALADFVPVSDSNIRDSIAKDIVAGGVDMFDDIARGIGDSFRGMCNRCWIVEMSFLPNNYMLGIVRGRPPLKLREYDAAELQGLFTESHSTDGNNFEFRHLRYAGFGVADRVAALMYYIGGASYTEPTGYTSMPLAV